MPNGDANPVGNIFKIIGTEYINPKRMDIPSRFIVVMAGVYPQRVEIYTGSGALKMLSQAPELSDIEIVILLSAMQLKSFARVKFKNEYYQNLVKSGFLRRNKSITNKGKNTLTAIDKEKKQEAINNLSKKIGRGIGLLNPY